MIFSKKLEKRKVFILKEKDAGLANQIHEHVLKKKMIQ